MNWAETMEGFSGLIQRKYCGLEEYMGGGSHGWTIKSFMWGGNLILNSEANGTETADKLSTCKKNALKQSWTRISRWNTLGGWWILLWDIGVNKGRGWHL